MNRSFLHRVDIWGVLAFTIPLAIYMLTLAPSVTFFDSGEFLTAIASLGTPHSPGYPLFVNYAKPFTFLPVGSVAFRINVATAVSAAAGCWMVYFLVRRLAAGAEVEEGRLHRLLPRVASLGAALAFAFTPRLWLQSNHDKPYPLVSVLAGIILFLLIRWRERYREGDEQPAYVYASAFILGLATGAHQTIVLFIPGYAWLILSVDWKLVRRVRELFIALFFSILGFSIYLHMPLRATRNPLLNWGDGKTLSQFLWNFLRKGYPVEQPERDFSLLLAQLKAFSIPWEFSWVGALLVLGGMVAFRKRLSAVIIFYGISILVFLAYIVGYQNTPRDLIFLTEEFFTPLYLIAAVFAGLGLYALLQYAVKDRSADAGPVAAGLCAAIALMLPAYLLAMNYYENDQHENYIAYDYAANSLRSLPEGAVLYTWGDSGAFPLWYLQGVERMREDVDLLHTPHLVFPWYLDAFPNLMRNSILRRLPDGVPPEQALILSIQEQMERRPVYIDFSTRYSVAIPQLGIRQHGIVYEITPPGMPIFPDASMWDIYASRGVLGGEMPFRDLDTEKAILIYSNSMLEEGEVLLSTNNTAQALMRIRQAVTVAPDLKPQADRILASHGYAQ